AGAVPKEQASVSRHDFTSLFAAMRASDHRFEHYKASAATNHKVPDCRAGEAGQSTVDEEHMVAQKICDDDQPNAGRTREKRTASPVLTIGSYLPDKRQRCHRLNQARSVATQNRNGPKAQHATNRCKQRKATG